MRLSTVCIMAALPGLLLLAIAAPVAAQFAPAPYPAGQNPYAGGGVPPGYSTSTSPGSNGGSLGDGTVIETYPPDLQGAPGALPPTQYGGAGVLSDDASGGVYVDDENCCEDEGTVLFDGDPFGEPTGRRWILPYLGQGRVYGSGGICNPRWYDFSVEYLNIFREGVSREVEFMRLISVDPNDPNNLTVNQVTALSTEDLGFQNLSAFRATLAYMIGPGDNIEATFMGALHMDTGSRFFARNNEETPGGPNQPFTNRLYSAFSDFGTNAPTTNAIPVTDAQGNVIGYDVIHRGGVVLDSMVDPTPNGADIDPRLPQAGFPDTDFATQSDIFYTMAFNSGELNFRRRFLSPNGRVHTSLLAGARYVNLSENFRWNITNVADQSGAMAYNVSTTNSLIGFQVGQEILASINKTFRFGGEAKAGIYGNVVSQNTVIDSSLRPILESAVGGAASFLGEGNLYLIAYINSQFSLKAGYTALYMERVALAPENVSFKNPFARDSNNRLIPRPRFLNVGGSVFLHGAHAGFEYNW